MAGGLVIWLVWVAWICLDLLGFVTCLGRWLMCLFDALQYASRSFLFVWLCRVRPWGLGDGREASSGLFVDGRAGVFGRACDRR